MTMQVKEVLAALESKGSKAGRDHVLAQKLWASGWYEARLAAAYIGDPVVLTKKEMNNRAAQWAKSPKEFVKRAGFALMASLAGHDKAASPEKFLAFLPMIEAGALDDRNFVKKGVSWALRRIGIRPEPVLRKAAMASAKRLAASETACARWVGKDALREFARAEARGK